MPYKLFQLIKRLWNIPDKYSYHDYTLVNEILLTGNEMDRTVVKFKSFHEAEDAEIMQQIKLSPEERQKIARLLKIRVYGENPPDIRDTRQSVKIRRCRNTC